MDLPVGTPRSSLRTCVPVENILGERVRARAGPGRLRPAESVTSCGSAGRTCDRTDVPARMGPQRVRQAPGRPGRHPGVDRRGEDRGRSAPADDAARGVAYRHRRCRAGAHEISAIKVAAPDAVGWILDRAIRSIGAGGMSQTFPWPCGAQPRTIRSIDGADEVHRMVLARRELAECRRTPASPQPGGNLDHIRPGRRRSNAGRKFSRRPARSIGHGSGRASQSRPPSNGPHHANDVDSVGMGTVVQAGTGLTRLGSPRPTRVCRCTFQL